MMKTKVLFMALILASGAVLAGCNQKKAYRPDAKIVSAMNAKYPKASRIEWDSKQGYQVAEFHDNGIETEAWFDNNGKWLMTESNLRYTDLPAAIRNEFEKSMYNGWKRDDIDKIERINAQPVYIIEVKKEGQELNLYYNANGTLVKTLNDKAGNPSHLYLPLNPQIQHKINQKYPDATVVETDTEKGLLHVDILDNGKSKETIFRGDEWLATCWEVKKAEVPSVVLEALKKSVYADYKIDDIDFYETPNQSYYLFELEQGDSDVYLGIDPAGNVINNPQRF